MSLYNAMFGNNPAAGLLLSMLKLGPQDVGRFRDCYLSRTVDGQRIIVVYTRNGGGNRGDYEAVTEKLQAHPEYLNDTDDSFDSTYASYFFKVPAECKEVAEVLANMGAEPGVSPQEKFKTFIEGMQAAPTTGV